MKNQDKSETKDQARARIAAALAVEVKSYQEAGMPNEVLGLKVYGALVEARLEIEQLKATARRLAEQLGKEIENIASTAKPS